jgi:glycosyltransferase involved in cell wall biosynthesis
VIHSDGKRPATVPLRLGVLVDLKLVPEAGGHVKCWERFAEAARDVPDRIDLTIHFSGDAEDRIVLAPNVRYVVHRPVLSTTRFPFFRHSPDHTDIAPFHPGLNRHLPDYHVVHTTDAYFAFAKTAMRWTEEQGVPLVHSTHTDTPKYARVFARDIIRSLLGHGALSRWLLRRGRVQKWAAASFERRLEHHLSRCSRVLASSEDDFRYASALVPADRVTRLRRGVDKEYFHPQWRDPRQVETAYGVPEDRFLLLFVGRVDESKSPMVLAKAARALGRRGVPVHVIFAGRGAQSGAVKELLGSAATVLGPLPQAALRTLYASADLFAFPSTTEVSPNVVLEAKSAGLPVLVSGEGGSAQMVRQSGVDGLVIRSSSPAEWAAAIEALWRDPARLASMREAARRHVETAWPSWLDVLREDLLPAWEAAAAETAPLPSPVQKACPEGTRSRQSAVGSRQ